MFCLDTELSPRRRPHKVGHVYITLYILQEFNSSLSFDSSTPTFREQLPWLSLPPETCPMGSLSSSCSNKSWRPSTRRGVPLGYATRSKLTDDTVVQQLEIAELRAETHELRQANASLERQVKEGLVSSHLYLYTKSSCCNLHMLEIDRRRVIPLRGARLR